MAEAFTEAWWGTGSLAEMQSGTIRLLDVTVTMYDGMSGGQVFDADSLPLTNQVGLSGGETGAPNAAAVITWRTERAGRSYRGRTYVAGVSTSLVDESFGALNSSGTSKFATGAEVFMNALGSGNGLEPCVVSRFSEGEERPIPEVTTIISWATRRAMRTQRRRQSRVP